MVLQRYLRFEEEAVRRQTDEDTSEEEEEEESAPTDSSVLKMNAFARHRHEAYEPCVVALLGGVLEFSPAQFAQNLAWVAPLLSRLVICESLEVRLNVREIYRVFVNPLVLEAAAPA